MNQELLRHFQTLTDDERERLRNGDFTYRPPHVVNASKYLKAGKQIVLSVNDRFHATSEHTHDFVEMVYVCTGHITHIVNGTEVIQRAGELLILNQYTRQEILPAGIDDIAVNFIILPSFFELTLGMMGDTESDLRTFLLSCLKNEEQLGGYLHFQVADVLPVQNLVENMLWSLVNNVPYRRSVNQFTMGLLFLHLFNHMGRARPASKQDEMTFQVLQYLDERYAGGTLGELARSLGYNMNWLSGEIKRLTGSTFKQLQKSKRISQAKFLLSTTRLPVMDIAKQVGYNDTSHFYRLFQELTGCSPKHYRDGNKVNFR